VELAAGDPPSGDYRLLRQSQEAVHGIGVLASWPAGEEGANGDYTVRLSAADAAGNTTNTVATLSVHNDAQGPEIELITPTNSPLLDDVAFELRARDIHADYDYDTGLRSFKVWIEYQKGEAWEAMGIDGYRWPDAEETWLDQAWSTPKTDDAICTKSIDTRRYQAIGQSPLKLRAEARDASGNVTKFEQAFTINNGIFNAYCDPSVILVVPPEQNPDELPDHTVINVFSSNQVLPQIEVRNTTDCLQVAPSRLIAGSNWIHTDTYRYEFRWPPDNTDPGDVDAGPYTVHVTEGDDTTTFPLVVIKEATQPEATLSGPMQTILFKNAPNASEGGGESTTGTVLFTGSVSCDGLGAAAQPATSNADIGRTFPAAQPYWRLIYKRSAAEPLIDNHDLPTTFIQASMAHEANWTEIAHGFVEIGDDPTTDVVASWDITRVPAGNYDVMLMVADGLKWYVAAVVPGYRVTRKSMTAGDNAEDREPGVLKLRQVDMSVNFAGFPIEIARTYSSLRASELSDFGHGWKLDALNLKISHTEVENTTFGERLEADITLPDGRTLTYTNNPPAWSGSVYYDKNMWQNEEAFAERPYGQMLWLPGRVTNNPNYDWMSTGHDRENTAGYALVNSYRTAKGLDPDPDGAIACLKLEDGTFLIFEWDSGRLLQQNYDSDANEVRGVDFTYGDQPNTPNLEDNEVLIQDHLGRKITIARNDDGLIASVEDPRGRAVNYQYNDANELVKITDRAGGIRWLEYKQPDDDDYFPHFLDRMIVDRQTSSSQIIIATNADPVAPGTYGEIDEYDTVVAYTYNDDARLAGIDTGAGVIGMEYQDNGDGSGIQTVVDEDTGGRTDVEYDSDGRVIKQTNAAGVITTYAYFPEHDEGTSVSCPEGALASQTEGGVTTEFEYDLDPYDPQYFGMGGLAQQYLDFWTNHGNPDITNDYLADGNTLKPGYLTSQQAQPSTVNTPAIDANGQDVGDNTVSINYEIPSLASTPWMPDGTGKIYQVTDPEGRNIDMDYGTTLVDDVIVGPDRNEMTQIAGPGTRVENAYYAAGETTSDTFLGRLEESVSIKTVGAQDDYLSTTTYAYTTGTIATFATLQSALETTVTTDLLSLLLPVEGSGYDDDFYLEKQTVTTITPEGEGTTETVSVSYIDAMGNTLASMSNDGIWAFTFHDQENRVWVTAAHDGALAANDYDSAGLLLRHVTRDADANTSWTRYTYDEQGRRTATERDGVTVSSRTRATTPEGGRREAVANFNSTTGEPAGQTVTITDSAGRTVKEQYITAAGERRETVYGYDEHGRRDYVRSPRGLETFTTYDAAGRQIQTCTVADGIETVEYRGYDRYGRTQWTQTALQAEASKYTTYEYELSVAVDDPRYGQLKKLYHEDTDNDPTNASAGMWESYEYDDEGRQTAVIKPVQLDATTTASVKTTTIYNDEGQVHQIVFNDVDNVTDSSRQDLVFTFAYDDNGNRTQVTYPSGMTRDLDQEEDPADPPAYDVSYDYDAEGLLSKITKPEGTLYYSHDAFGSLAEISIYGHTTTYDYDWFGRLSRMSMGPGQVDYSYNSAGLIKQIENYIADTREVRSYSSLGRVEKLTHYDSDGDIYFEADYELGVDGQRVGVLEKRKNQADVKWDYEYDELGRLKVEKRDVNNDASFERHVSYTYDCDSNRKTETDELTSIVKEYFYFANTQRLQKIERDSVLYESYTWTEDGQQATKISYDSVGQNETKQAFTWDATGTLGEVAQYEWQGGAWELAGRVEYDYDDRGEKIARRLYDADGGLVDHERYLIDRQNPSGYSQVVAVIDGQSGALRRLNSYDSHGISGQQTISSDGVASLHMTRDALGSIRSLTGSDAFGDAISESVNYTAFGSPLGTPSSLTDYRFTGQTRDNTTGLQYHRARWLDTSRGQWASTDPKLDFWYNQASYYSYAGSNGINLIDPLGTTSLGEMQVVNFVVRTLTEQDFEGGIGILEQATGLMSAIQSKQQLESVMMGIQIYRVLQVVSTVIALLGLAVIVAVAFAKICRWVFSLPGMRTLGSVIRYFGKRTRILCSRILFRATRCIVYRGKLIRLKRIENVKVYVAVGERWRDASRAPRTSIWAGRFNRKGKDAVWFGDEPDTCLKEVGYHLKDRTPSTRPRYHVSEVELTQDNVLDLTDPDVAAKFPRMGEYLDEGADLSDYAASVEMADEMRDLGVDAIMFPSVRNKGATNIVCFKGGDYVETAITREAHEVIIP
ncbi:RES domain-containing protein, partial [Candidatus Sumerlaeota bacterium]